MKKFMYLIFAIPTLILAEILSGGNSTSFQNFLLIFIYLSTMEIRFGAEGGEK